MPPIRTRGDLHKKAARALLRAAFINGCRFRFRRCIPIDEQRKGFVMGQERKARRRPSPLPWGSGATQKIPLDHLSLVSKCGFGSRAAGKKK